MEHWVKLTELAGGETRVYYDPASRRVLFQGDGATIAMDAEGLMKVALALGDKRAAVQRARQAGYRVQERKLGVFSSRWVDV